MTVTYIPVMAIQRTIAVTIKDLPDGSFTVDSAFDPPLPEDDDAEVEVTPALVALETMIKSLDKDPDLVDLPPTTISN